MFEFDQYLGFLAVMAIITMGFWIMIFLTLFAIPYWLFGYAMESFNEWRTEKNIDKKK
ncbi:MAG: hypothetical protein CMC79_01340 [Flavobacteriaceae bacterium]|nr:hypothetical protein [Flavobacteriaceae bacterium]|tara:strand:+ start:1914 stop:2087 length:174 start_codon:yes stop_codon:yes gene_type:complete